MRSCFSAPLLAVAASLLSVASVAQTRFCIGGDLDHISAADRATCSATMQAVRATAASLQAPNGWHFVVVCGEEGWKNYASFSSRGEAVLERIADTDHAQQTTYFREANLHTAQVHGLERAVAHEIASILLKTDDEIAIQTQMATWERKGLVEEALLTR